MREIIVMALYGAYCRCPSCHNLVVLHLTMQIFFQILFNANMRVIWGLLGIVREFIVLKNTLETKNLK